MKNYVISLAILFVLAAGALALLLRQDAQAQPASPAQNETQQNIADFPEPPPGAIVFDMKYRGLSGEKDELRYNSYWGYGQREKKTPFIEKVRKNGGQFSTVYNSHFKGAEWSAVELKGDEAVAFYFDLNADGKVSDNEKILPVTSEESGSSRHWEFVTPDFVLTTDKGVRAPFRTLLQVRFYGKSSRPTCMWSPSCVLEGTSTLAGKPTKLILYASGFSGSFTEFGKCSYSLLGADEQTGRYVSRQTLSSLVNYDGQYYRMKLYGAHAKGKNVQAVLEKYTGDTGEMAVKLIGNSELKAELGSASLAGTKHDTIRFNISGGQSVLPAEAYELRSGYINYGTDTDDLCRVSIKEGPEFEIEADKTCDVELGKPTLSVRAIDEKERYRSNAEEKSVFSEGTRIHLSPKIVGKAGELYGRFSRRDDNSRRYEDVEPTIRIVDSKGNEVASATMEYG
ncbi:MAG: hypothetical protein JSW59_18485 [Phycisphaerales bacterium]|nr:MAG: hypothetical protein JSW59_18485 [Phycisphaerales bacterium]